MTHPTVEGGGAELGRFLRARRGQVTPTEVGLPPVQGIRRTSGLRREELATLAGISNDYYIRLERGKETRPSPEVIDALARAPDGARRARASPLTCRARRPASLRTSAGTEPGRLSRGPHPARLPSSQPCARHGPQPRPPSL